jgi:glycosyltransferase involved in cell wall biosynthesis
MRVLLLSQWYVPEPDIKVHILGRDLAVRGHQVTAITGFPNYPQGRIYPGYRQKLWQIEHLDGVRVIRLLLYPNHSWSGLRRILNYLSFALSASSIGAALCGPADVMWVYHPPLTVGIPACWIGLLRRIPYIFNIHDMWPETLAATGMLPSSIALKWMGALARFVYRRAAAITVVSPGFRRNLIEKGVPADKIHVIPNWADEDVYRPVPRDEALAAEYGLSEHFNVMFGGNMGAAQAMENVLHAAERLRDIPAVQFVLIGDGVDAERLRQLAHERDLNNVRFIGRQPAERMPYFFAWADALLVHLKRDPLFEITIPSKTIAYLAYGRPIITCTAGDATDVVRDAGAGLVCAPEDPAALAQAVRELVAMPLEQRQAFLQKYTRAVLVDKYEKLLEETAKMKKIRR